MRSWNAPARFHDIVCIRMNFPKSSDQNLSWRVCCGLAGILAVVSFTPLVIPMGRSGPALEGLPYTLWVGLAVAVAFVALTFVGTRVHPDANRHDEPADRPHE